MGTGWKWHGTELKYHYDAIGSQWWREIVLMGGVSGVSPGYPHSAKKKKKKKDLGKARIYRNS